MKAGSDLSNLKKKFESFMVEFKEERENVINILKIVIEQKRIEDFKQILSMKHEENDKRMREFIKNKYVEFVNSLQHITECKTVAGVTEEVLNQLENKIQKFLAGFSGIYLDKIIKKEGLTNIKTEKQKLNLAYIFFAYLNKANVCLKAQQFELTIRVISTATEKYLKQFPVTSQVYKRGEQVLAVIKNKITTSIEEKLSNWLLFINKEQHSIGETLYKRVKNEEEKYQNSKSHFSVGSNDKINIRTTKNIVDNLLLIRNTANLNYMMNTNSVLKASVLKQTEMFDEMDIINMVSNIDLNFLEQTYTIYKKVDIDTKFIEHFVNFRQNLLQSLIKIQQNSDNMKFNYESYFSDLLGYLIIQIAVFELLPVLYPKRKFEDNMNFFLKELISNLSNELGILNSQEEFISLQRGIFIFVKANERIGLKERVGIDVKCSLFEMLKDKSEDLNFLLIKKYDNIFVNLLYEEKFINIEIHNKEELMKFVTQYSISLDNNIIYPFKLPYTKFVIEVNERFKNYIDELFEFIAPLYTEYETIMEILVKNFLKKINEVFHTFSNFHDQDLNIILAAHICNNIKYINNSRDFYTKYVVSKCNLKNPVNLYTKDSFQNTWENYEEIIYENLKNKIREFLLELINENWMPDKPDEHSHGYVEAMISYLSVIYDSLYSLSPYYVDNCFKAAVDYIPKIYFQEILFNCKYMKSYNFYFIENLKTDIETLDDFLNKINMNSKGNSGKGFYNCLLPVKQLLVIFFNKKYDQFLDKTNVDKFYEVKVATLIEFLSKYKNVKKSEKKGKITESDVSSIIKKLKEYK